MTCVNSSLNHGYNSKHTGGAHFGRADGSVVFISENVDSLVYYSIATIDGSETLTGAW